MLFEMTQEDIDSVPKFKFSLSISQNCPIANCLKRYGYKPSVGRKEIYFRDLEISKLVTMPPDLSTFREAYDFGFDVEPITFSLDV